MPDTDQNNEWENKEEEMERFIQEQDTTNDNRPRVNDDNGEDLQDGEGEEVHIDSQEEEVPEKFSELGDEGVREGENPEVMEILDSDTEMQDSIPEDQLSG